MQLLSLTKARMKLEPAEMKDKVKGRASDSPNSAPRYEHRRRNKVPPMPVSRANKLVRQCCLSRPSHRMALLFCTVREASSDGIVLGISQGFVLHWGQQNHCLLEAQHRMLLSYRSPVRTIKQLSVKQTCTVATRRTRQSAW